VKDLTVRSFVTSWRILDDNEAQKMKKTEIPVWQAFREKDHKKRCTFPSGKKNSRNNPNFTQ